MSKILVIQHSPTERLGSFEREIELQKMTATLLRVYENPVFPSGAELEGYGALIVLGGSMSVTEEKKYPWIKQELLVLQEALRQRKPVLGTCIGAQLFAKACGATVSKGAVKEIGWGPIRFDDWFSKRNPLTFQLDLAKPHTVFHWHGDTFDFPVEGYRLAWNETYPGQMFCYQGNAIGIQFHPEVTEGMIRQWVESGASELKEAKVDPQKILADIPKYLPELEKLCHKFFYGFASLVRENIRRAA